MERALFVLVDLLGTFAFAVSGAAAARERRLDLFGVYAVAFVTACGGGIVRDMCLAAVPPSGISDWRYLACSTLAATMTVWANRWVERLKQPVMLFDSLGLGFFAVVGAHKALAHGANAEAAIVLGMVTAVGGGVMQTFSSPAFLRSSRGSSMRSRRSSPRSSRSSRKSTVGPSVSRRGSPLACASSSAS